MTDGMHNVVLIAVFCYFAFGATQAIAMSMLSMGFAGKFDWRVILIFLFWPIWYLARIPYLGLFFLALGIAAGMTWLVSLVLP